MEGEWVGGKECRGGSGVGGCPAGQIPQLLPVPLLLCFLVPLGPVRFLLCMSVVTSTVDLLAADTEQTSPQISELGFCFIKETQCSMDFAYFLQYSDKRQL